jgi:protein-tyrosine-phosphatase
MTEVLFVCEHGAAKSVVAAAIYRQKAAELARSGSATARGTDPDAEIPAHVVAGLARHGLQPVDPQPRQLSGADVARAGLVVTFGVEPGAVISTSRRLRWDDIPAVSADFELPFEAIRASVEALFDDPEEDRLTR